MDLIRAHQLVESGHRHDAYDMVTQNAPSATTQQAILSAVKRSLRLWLTYRDAVSKACGLKKP
jgi:pyrroloquinoline-quinone synthase